MSETLTARSVSVVLLAAALALPACAPEAQAPVVKSSAAEGAFAERYPDVLADSTAHVEGGEAEVARIKGELPTYPDAVKKTDYALMREMLVKADSAGQSQAYTENVRQNEAVSSFVSEEKDKLAQQTAGAVRYALTDKGASADEIEAGSNAAAAGQQRAVQKQLEERAHETNAAYRFIDDHEEQLGKANVPTLQKQADDVALASHIVHVVLPREKERLTQLVADADAVKKTLDKTIEEEKAVSADKATTPRRKKIADGHVKDAEASRARVDETLQKANTALTDLDKRTKELGDAYDQALLELLDKLDDLAKASPAPAT